MTINLGLIKVKISVLPVWLIKHRTKKAYLSNGHYAGAASYYKREMERVRDPEDVSLHDALKFVQKLMDKYPEPLEKAKESALEFMRDLDDYRKHIQEIRESPDYTGD